MSVRNDLAQVMAGKKRFLFLRGAVSNNLEKVFTGATTIETNALRILKRNVENRRAHISVPWRMLIAPEAHVIYRELLPDWFHMAEQRPVHAALPLLGDHGLYPERELLAAKAAGIPVYTGEDSHWTIQGAVLTYQLLRQQLAPLHEFANELPDLPHRETGHLRTTVEPNYTSASLDTELTAPEHLLKQSLCFYSGVAADGAISILRNPTRHARVLIFGTSFSTLFVRPVFFDAGELILVHSTGFGFDRAIYDTLQPDCVIFETPERVLHRPMVDTNGSSALLSLGIKGYRQAKPVITKDVEQLDPRTRRLVSACLHALAIPSGKTVLDHDALGDVDEYGRSLVSDLYSSPSPDQWCQFASVLNEKQHLQSVWQGHYYSQGVMAAGLKTIDDGEIDLDAAPVLPTSEMGLLMKIRHAVHASKRDEARLMLEEFLRDFGATDAAMYYVKALGLN